MAVATQALQSTPPERPERPTPRAVYRRRRLGALALLVALSAGAGAAAPLRSEAAPAHQPEPVTVVVGPGDTVLGLVFPHVPAGEDVRHYAAEVAAHNGLDARDLRPGTVLELPRR